MRLFLIATLLFAGFFSQDLKAGVFDGHRHRRDELVGAKYIYTIIIGGGPGAVSRSCKQVAFKLVNKDGLYTALHGFYQLNQPGKNFKNYYVDRIIEYDGNVIYDASNSKVRLNVSEVCLESDMAFIPISKLNVPEFPGHNKGLTLRVDSALDYLNVPLIVPVLKQCGPVVIDIRPEPVVGGVTREFQAILDEDPTFVCNKYRIPSPEQQVLFFENNYLEAGTSGAPIFLNKKSAEIIGVINGVLTKSMEKTPKLIKPTTWGIFFSLDCFRSFDQTKDDDTGQLLTAFRIALEKGGISQFQSKLETDTPKISQRFTKKAIVQTPLWRKAIKKGFKPINGTPSLRSFEEFPLIYKYYNRVDDYVFIHLDDDREIGILYDWLYRGSDSYQEFQKTYGATIKNNYPVTKWLVTGFYDYLKYKITISSNKGAEKSDKASPVIRKERERYKKSLLSAIDSLYQYSKIPETDWALWRKADLNIMSVVQNFIYKAQTILYLAKEPEIKLPDPPVSAQPIKDTTKGAKSKQLDSVPQNGKKLSIDLSSVLSLLIQEEYDKRRVMYEIPMTTFDVAKSRDNKTLYVGYKIDAPVKDIHARAFYCNYPPGACEFSGSQQAVIALGRALERFFEKYGKLIDLEGMSFNYSGFSDSLKFRGDLNCRVKVKDEDHKACSCLDIEDCHDIFILKNSKRSDDKNRALAYLRAYAIQSAIEESLPVVDKANESICAQFNELDSDGSLRGVRIEFSIKLKK